MNAIKHRKPIPKAPKGQRRQLLRSTLAQFSQFKEKNNQKLRVSARPTEGYFPSRDNANNEKWQTRKEIRDLLVKAEKSVGSGRRMNKTSRHFFAGFSLH